MKSVILLITTTLLSLSIHASQEAAAMGGSREAREPAFEPRGDRVDVAQYKSADQVPDLLSGLKNAARQRDQQYDAHDKGTRNIDRRKGSIKSSTKSSRPVGASENKGERIDF